MMLRMSLVPFLWFAVVPHCYAAAFMTRALLATTTCRRGPVFSLVLWERFATTHHRNPCDGRSSAISPSSSRSFQLCMVNEKENEYQDSDSVKNLAKEWTMRNSGKPPASLTTDGSSTSMPTLQAAAEAPSASSPSTPVTLVSMEKLAKEWTSRNREQQQQQPNSGDVQPVVASFPILPVHGSDLSTNTTHIPPIITSQSTKPLFFESSLTPPTTKPTTFPTSNFSPGSVIAQQDAIVVPQSFSFSSSSSSPSPLPPPPSSQGSKPWTPSTTFSKASSLSSSSLPKTSTTSLQDLAKIWRVMNVDKADEQLAARKHNNRPRNNNIIINPTHDQNNKTRRERRFGMNRRRPVFIDTLGYKEDDDTTTPENE